MSLDWEDAKVVIITFIINSEHSGGISSSSNKTTIAALYTTFQLTYLP